MSQSTYYSILGVTPDAEDIVITAAYRALAQRYHPDKWKRDPFEAQRRMTAINEAYSVLRDAIKRSKYDREQKNNSDFSESENSKDTDAAFNTFQRRLLKHNKMMTRFMCDYPISGRLPLHVASVSQKKLSDGLTQRVLVGGRCREQLTKKGL